MRSFLMAFLMVSLLAGCQSFADAEAQAETDCQRQGKHAQLKEPLPAGYGIASVEWVCVD